MEERSESKSLIPHDKGSRNGLQRSRIDSASKQRVMTTGSLIWRLTQAYPHVTVYKETMNEYVESLVGLPIESVEYACWRAKEESEYFPTIKRLMDLAREDMSRRRREEEDRERRREQAESHPSREGTIPWHKFFRTMRKNQVEEFLSHVGQIMIAMKLPVGFDPDGHGLDERQASVGRALRHAISGRNLEELRALHDEVDEMVRHEQEGLGLGDGEEDSDGH